ncbi:Lrp/AsnC family transcriptional regulator [Micromonospora sp. NPDC002296]|uniref:Lrp/AsnC family transcriptional regulator n=1 Tax=Micromonospora sp. NPDC002296 TaxID=3154271 RepID=UPI00331B77C2
MCQQIAQRKGAICVLDDLDHRLISELRHDSRAPVAVLARVLGVNRSTVTTRIERLRDSGVIEAFTVRLSNDVDRDAIRGVTMVRIEPNRGQDVVRAVRGYPEVETLFSTIGAWDLVLQLRAASLSELDLALERIRGLAGVLDTQTSLLFNSLTGGGSAAGADRPAATAAGAVSRVGAGRAESPGSRRR